MRAVGLLGSAQAPYFARKREFFNQASPYWELKDLRSDPDGSGPPVQPCPLLRGAAWLPPPDKKRKKRKWEMAAVAVSDAAAAAAAAAAANVWKRKREMDPKDDEDDSSNDGGEVGDGGEPSRAEAAMDEPDLTDSDEDEAGRSLTGPALTDVARQEGDQVLLHVVEKILNVRSHGETKQYQVKWAGYPEEEATWEPVENCSGCEKLVADFDAKCTRQMMSAATAAPLAEADADAAATAAPPASPLVVGQSVEPPLVVGQLCLGLQVLAVAKVQIGGAGRMLQFAVSRGSVVDFQGDAIVNAANSRGLSGGGVDAAINEAGGPALTSQREALPCNSKGERIPVGEARVTKGSGRLGVNFVIHAVGPKYRHLTEPVGAEWPEDRQLREAYAAAVDCANKHKCQTLAFSLLSAGIFRGPRALEDVLGIGCETVLQRSTAHASSSAAEGGVGGLRQVHMVGHSAHEVQVLLEAATKAGWNFTPEIRQMCQMQPRAMENQLEMRAQVSHKETVGSKDMNGPRPAGAAVAVAGTGADTIDLSNPLDLQDVVPPAVGTAAAATAAAEDDDDVEADATSNMQADMAVNHCADPISRKSPARSPLAPPRPQRQAKLIAKHGIHACVEMDSRCPDSYRVPQINPKFVEWKEENEIGHGTSAKVYEGLYKRKDVVALKVLTKSGDDDIAEAKLLKHCKHENVLAVFGVFESKNKRLVIVTELCERNSLDKMFEPKFSVELRERANSIMKAIATGMAHVSPRAPIAISSLPNYSV
eukprot:SAG22_NODE_646_length_8200_cov_8.958400_2_plen_764_part_00